MPHSTQGYEVDIYESRPWIGGKVASFKDKDGNDIEMGLHVFFGACTRLAGWAGAATGRATLPANVSECSRHSSGMGPHSREMTIALAAALLLCCVSQAAASPLQAATSTCSASWPSVGCWRTCCSRSTPTPSATRCAVPRCGFAMQCCAVLCCAGLASDQLAATAAAAAAAATRADAPRLLCCRCVGECCWTEVCEASSSLQGGDVRELDFRFFLGDTKIGAPFHGLRAFFTTPQVGWAGEVGDSWWVCGVLAGSALCCCGLGGWLCLAPPGKVARCLPLSCVSCVGAPLLSPAAPDLYTAVQSVLLPQLSFTDKVANSLALGTSPIVRSLFDPEGGMRDVRALDNVSFTGG